MIQFDSLQSIQVENLKNFIYNKYIMNNTTLDNYEQELEEGLTDDHLFAAMDEDWQKMYDTIQAWAQSQRKKKITFTSTRSTFEQFKENAKKMKLPYSTVLNALMELYNKWEIRLVDWNE